MRVQVKALLNAEPVLPGTLEERYNVCGKAGCRCKDKINPRRHGPYYRLSYSVKGRNSSVFVRRDDARAIKKMTENYRKARSNTQELSLAMVQAYRQYGLQGMLKKYRELSEWEGRKKSGTMRESSTLRNTRISRNNWKDKALERQAVLEKNRIQIRDIKKSRDTWKNKVLNAQREVKKLQKQLKDADKKISIVERNDNKKNSAL